MNRKTKLRARRVNDEIQIRRYGKWYDLESLRSLAAYKFNMYGNTESLKSTEDYEDFDITYVRPTFRFEDQHRGIVAPTAFFNYLCDDVMEIDFETAKELFEMHPVVDKRGLCSIGDPYRISYDTNYVPRDEKNKVEWFKKHARAPFFVWNDWKSIEFSLKQGIFLKWDDDAEEKIMNMPLTCNNEDIDTVSDLCIAEKLFITT